MGLGHVPGRGRTLTTIPVGKEKSTDPFFGLLDFPNKNAGVF
jgi:hypothetical protein